MSVEIKEDLLSDLSDWCITQEPQLKRYKGTRNFKELIIIYLEKILGKIIPNPRVVHIAAGLQDNAKFLKYRDVILDIKSKFESGDPDVSKYLSEKAGNRDFLLRDFGLHHLHLGLCKNSSYSGRTDDLLVVKINRKEVYFIDFITHNFFINGIGLTKLLENLDRAFPELLKPFELQFLPPSKLDSFTDEEIWRLLVDGKVSAALYVNNKCIFPLGWGPVTSGHPLRVINDSAVLLEEITNCSYSIRKYYKRIYRQLLKDGIKVKRLNFQLVVGKHIHDRKYMEINSNRQLYFIKDYNDDLIPKVFSNLLKNICKINSRLS